MSDTDSANAKKTVFHICTGLDVGGTEQQLIELLRCLAPSRWRSRVAVFQPGGALVDEARRLGIEPTLVPLPRSLARPAALQAVLRLAWAIRRAGAALVHCHDPYSVLIGVPAARLTGTPVVAARRDQGDHLGPVQRFALGRVLRLATRVLANAECVAAIAIRDDHVPLERVVLVPNGIDLPRFDARVAANDELGFFGGRRTVVTVAHMTHPIKGHDDLLDAAALVRERFPDVLFLVVGGGPREAELREKARRLGLSESVIFVGQRIDAPAFLARADVVCHPARSEGLPNAVLEAMAAARPIVATTAGGTSDLLQDGVHGVLVPPVAPTALAAGLITLLADLPAARRLGENARRRVERRFTSEQLFRRIDAVYTSIS